MPRPSKKITPGSLTEPMPAARSASWRKHAGPEDSEQYEPDGSVLIDAVTQETVATIDLTDTDAPAVTVTDTSHVPDRVEPLPQLVWTTERTIDGRTYRRSDSLVPESDVSAG